MGSRESSKPVTVERVSGVSGWEEITGRDQGNGESLTGNDTVVILKQPPTDAAAPLRRVRGFRDQLVTGGSLFIKLFGLDGHNEDGLAENKTDNGKGLGSFVLRMTDG